jgi:hypothetical protein
MIAAPLIARPVTPRAHAPARPEAAADGPPTDARTLEERIDASVDAALAEALAKVKTPEDDELAKQQAAFDRMMQQRTEQEREANAIREFGMAQQKKENDFLQEFIRMI